MTYQHLRIIRRIDRNTIAVFQCLKNILKDQYSIQSMDYIYMDSDIEKQLLLSEKNLLELISDDDPICRSGGYDSIEDAIKAFID
ncbi:MAG: hypothetical protein U0Z75_04605 [Deinococcaceae bacterium]